MKHLKSFEGYINDAVVESVNPLNESEVFISDPKFTDEATLKADILKNAGPALVKFLKDHGLTWPADLEIQDAGNRMKLVPKKPVTGADLGIMQYGFEKVWIVFFNGGSFPKVNKAAKEAFEFTPAIWCNLNYSYEHVSGGSNGTNLVLPGERRSDIFYAVAEGKWYTESEAIKAKLF